MKANIRKLVYIVIRLILSLLIYIKSSVLSNLFFPKDIVRLNIFWKKKTSEENSILLKSLYMNMKKKEIIKIT